MKLVLRRAAVGAAAFFAASAIAAPAAFADTTADLGVTLGGTTLSFGPAAKELGVSVTNHGPDTINGYKLTFDTSLLDTAKVELVLPDWCDDATKTCTSIASLANAENHDYPIFQLKRKPAATAGAAGKLTISVSSTVSDPNTANNSASADVTLLESTGVDLKVFANDIGIDEEGDLTPILPGGTSTSTGFFYNQGTKTAKGLRATIVLPPGVTFVDHEVFCEYSDGDTKAVCTAESATLPGGGTFDNPDSWFELPPLDVKVASTVTPLVNISGGKATVEALGEVEEVPAVSGNSAGKGPWGGSANAAQFKDADFSDNSDDFIVYVGGNLPKTGTNVMLIAGIGAGVLIAGGALFLITRRRRVVA